jgi:integrase
MDPREFARLQAVMAKEAAEVRPKKIDTVYVSDAERDLFLEAVARRRLIAQRDPYMRLFPFSKRQFQYLFNYYRGRAGLREGLSPHALRRFVATRLTQLTGERRLATVRLRHHEASVTMGYVDFPPETQIALLNKVEPVW